MTKKQINQDQNQIIKKQLENAICRDHTGKMHDIQSLSTSVLMNEQCKINSTIPGAICGKCYAIKQLKRYSNLDKKLERNTALLTTDILPVEALPVITSLYFRFEAFGDLNNAVQVVNYFNICKKNKYVHFALWTKNPRFIDQAMKEYNIKKPNNLNIIYSSLFLNKPVKAIREKYSFIDKVFTVYDPETIKNDNITINCGSRSCIDCLKCYNKNKITEISEKLK